MSSIGTGTATEPGTKLGEPGRSGRKWKAGLLSLVAAFVVLAVYDLSSVAGHVSAHQAPTAAASHPAAAPSAPAPSAAAPPTRAQAPALPQKVMSVTAFGPDGTSDGDHPGTAALVGPVRPAAGSTVAGDTAPQPWSTSWYATPQFGNLQPGTGLLLDLGHPVTVSSVVLALGPKRGADVQVRVGNSPSLASLPVTASATGAAGDVRVPVSAETAGRYVLVWFTRLPPDGQGHYQVDVYGVTVNGASAAS